MNDHNITIGERTFKVVPELNDLHNTIKDFRGCFDIYEDDKKVGHIAYTHTSWEFHNTDNLNQHEQLELAEDIYYQYTINMSQ